MALISFDEDEVIEYTPEYHGNRDDDNPCVVDLKFVSYTRVKFYEKLLAKRVKDMTKGTTNIVKIVEAQGEAGKEIQLKQWLDNVVIIKGFTVKGRAITDPAEFYGKADNELITEIIQAMESSAKLSEGQVKNSSGVSGGPSSQEAKTESPSVAKTAETMTEKPETAGTGADSQTQPAQ